MQELRQAGSLVELIRQRQSVLRHSRFNEERVEACFKDDEQYNAGNFGWPGCPFVWNVIGNAM